MGKQKGTNKIKSTLLLLITGVGIILLWRGIWESSEQFFDEHISLILGLVILVGVALFQRRQIFKFFGSG